MVFAQRNPAPRAAAQRGRGACVFRPARRASGGAVAAVGDRRGLCPKGTQTRFDSFVLHMQHETVRAVMVAARPFPPFSRARPIHSLINPDSSCRTLAVNSCTFQLLCVRWIGVLITSRHATDYW